MGDPEVLSKVMGTLIPSFCTELHELGGLLQPQGFGGLGISAEPGERWGLLEKHMSVFQVFLVHRKCLSCTSQILNSGIPFSGSGIEIWGVLDQLTLTVTPHTGLCSSGDAAVW